jgi:hypothetical protein
MEVIEVAAGVLLLIGFVSGYGVRALISHLRHEKARRRHFDRMVEEIARTGKQERLGITFQRDDGARDFQEG